MRTRNYVGMLVIILVAVVLLTVVLYWFAFPSGPNHMIHP